MEKIYAKNIKEIKENIAELENEGVVLECFDIEELEECLNNPEDFKITPLEFAEELENDIDDISRIISKLSSSAIKLADILYEEEE